MKRARRSELFYFALEEGSSQAVSQLPFLPAGSLFLLGFPLCSFLLCRLSLSSLLLSYFLLRFAFCRFLLGLALGDFLFRFAFCRFLLGLALGDFLLRFSLSLLLGYFFLRRFLFCFLLCCLSLSSLFLRYFFLRLFLGDFLLCYAAFFRRCFFLYSYFTLLRDFALRSFFTSLLFGSHAFLRVRYPELSIYNKARKTSKPNAVRTPRKIAA